MNRKLVVLLLISIISNVIRAQEGLYQKLSFVNSDGSYNTDATYFIRDDQVTDRAKLKLNLGDENSSDFEIGYKLYTDGKWYKNFSLTGYGVGYFRDKLGIGIDSPSEKLDVNGNIKLSGTLYTRYFELRETLNNDPTLYFKKDGWGRIIGKNKLAFWGNEDGLTTTNPHLLISNNGQVGIGTQSPKGLLHVSGTVATSIISSTKDNIHFQYRWNPTGDQAYIWNSGAAMKFGTATGLNAENWSEKLRICDNGNIAIGKTLADAKLDVAGNIKAHEIEVTLASIDDMRLNGTLAANNITYTANGQTADFVFEEDYNLRSLNEIETFIKTNKHLPDIPSAKDMEEKGVNLAEMNKLLLQKVEELTLYAIEKDKEVRNLKEKSESLEERLVKLEIFIKGK